MQFICIVVTLKVISLAVENDCSDDSVCFHVSAGGIILKNHLAKAPESATFTSPDKQNRSESSMMCSDSGCLHSEVHTLYMRWERSRENTRVTFISYFFFSTYFFSFSYLMVLLSSTIFLPIDVLLFCIL